MKKKVAAVLLSIALCASIAGPAYAFLDLNKDGVCDNCNESQALCHCGAHVFGIGDEWPHDITPINRDTHEALKNKATQNPYLWSYGNGGCTIVIVGGSVNPGR